MKRLKHLLTGKTATQGGILLLLLLLWEAAFRFHLVEELLLPSFSSVLAVLRTEYGTLIWRLGVTLIYIGCGLGISLLLAGPFTFLAIRSPVCAGILEMILAMMHPVPSVALLPLLIIWFGIGPFSLIIVIVNSALWPLFLNSYTGFKTVHQTYLEVGRNIGLKEFRLIASIMLPAALPYLLTGFEISWARSWRAAIAVELVFGAATTSGGIGWTIYMAYFDIEMALMVAAILTIALVGVLMERCVMDNIEKYTVVRWGMVQQTETLKTG